MFFEKSCDVVQALITGWLILTKEYRRVRFYFFAVRVLRWGIRLGRTIITGCAFVGHRPQPIFIQLADFAFHQFALSTLKTDRIASTLLQLILLTLALQVHPLLLALVDHSLQDKARLTAKGKHQRDQYKEMGLVLEGGLARGIDKFDQVGEAGHITDKSDHDGDDDGHMQRSNHGELLVVARIVCLWDGDEVVGARVFLWGRRVKDLTSEI